MRRLLVLCTIALVGLMAAPLASACSNTGYANAVLRANNKAMYGTDLMSAGLFREASAAFDSALRMHANATYPCASGLRNVRLTYHSGLADWAAGARAAARGSLAAGLRYIQRGTAKVKYATNQLKTYMG